MEPPTGEFTKIATGRCDHPELSCWRIEEGLFAGDTYIFNGGGGHDRIVDAGVAGDQAFAFIGGGAFTGVAGQLRVESISGARRVYGDVDGDAVADFQIEVTGSLSLTASDFLL